MAGWIGGGLVVKPAHMDWRWWHGIGSMIGIRVGEGVVVQVGRKGWRWWQGDGGRGDGMWSSRHGVILK